jgi:hypothetical protein
MERVNVSKEDGEPVPKFIYRYSMRATISHRSRKMLIFVFFLSPWRFFRLDIQILRINVMMLGVT